MAWKTSNVGVVKHPAKASNNLRNEIGNMTGGSIDGSLSATTVVQAPSMLPSSHPKITNSEDTRRVTPTTDHHPETAKVEKLNHPPPFAGRHTEACPLVGQLHEPRPGPGTA
jgi:hypothetical protein